MLYRCCKVNLALEEFVGAYFVLLVYIILRLLINRHVLVVIQVMDISIHANTFGEVWTLHLDVSVARNNIIWIASARSHIIVVIIISTARLVIVIIIYHNLGVRTLWPGGLLLQLHLLLLMILLIIILMLIQLVWYQGLIETKRLWLVGV